MTTAVPSTYAESATVGVAEPSERSMDAPPPAVT
jgi:hypothetical protein